MQTATNLKYYESGFSKIINRDKKSVPVNIRLRIARERKKYTLSRATQELNRQGINCAMSTLQSYEAAEESLNRRLPSVKMLISLALLYDCSTDYLLGLSDEINPYTTDIHTTLIRNHSLSWRNEKMDAHQLSMIIHKVEQIMAL